jgi:hypothetical protein
MPARLTGVRQMYDLHCLAFLCFAATMGEVTRG